MDGRKPDPQYRVIWMPKKNLAQVRLARSQTESRTTIVRMGTRFGLRADKDHAEQVHLQHRPDLMFLDGQALRPFKVGPVSVWIHQSSTVQRVSTPRMECAASSAHVPTPGVRRHLLACHGSSRANALDLPNEAWRCTDCKNGGHQGVQLCPVLITSSHPRKPSRRWHGGSKRPQLIHGSSKTHGNPGGARKAVTTTSMPAVSQGQLTALEQRLEQKIQASTAEAKR